jgi:hypothetical protein
MHKKRLQEEQESNNRTVEYMGWLHSSRQTTAKQMKAPWRARNSLTCASFHRRLHSLTPAQLTQRCSTA